MDKKDLILSLVAFLVSSLTCVAAAVQIACSQYLLNFTTSSQAIPILYFQLSDLIIPYAEILAGMLSNENTYM